jgi:hypothetical protein
MKNEQHYQDADAQISKENPSEILSNVLSLMHQLEMLAHKTGLQVSREAFEGLADVFHRAFTWLRTTAILSTQSLGALTRALPEEDAWRRYRRGEHAAAWAAVELARHYKQVKAELRSRSKYSINRLRDLRLGFKMGEFDFPPNDWFRKEYDRQTDHRPTGLMAVWVARKIQEMRPLKTNRSEWQSYASIEIVQGQLRFRPEHETNDILAELFRSDLVQGQALRRLDDLPTFGSSNIADIEAWRKFVLRQVLTQKKIIDEFDSLFPDSRKKLDGVVAATLRAAWRAVRDGGDVILPEV